MREKIGEILCPNCQTRLSIWQAKSGSGFCSCGFCGFRGFNLHIRDKEGELIEDTILDKNAFKGKNDEEVTDEWLRSLPNQNSEKL